MVCFFACSTQQNKTQFPANLSDYQEKFRPQFHFSPDSMWMNDPNGMVFFEGEYHLFYQYYPDSNVWGPMHWGHAISKDLVHWEHLPIALYPDEKGYIFSGSAVVDWNNTSGLGKEEEPPMIAIFTYHDPKGWESGAIDFQTQGIAYSNDKGRTWLKYEGNPVLPNPGIADFRDPKVIWYNPGKKWIMTLAVWDHVSFYSSPNLLNWTFESDFGAEWGTHAGVWECPDLFPMTTGSGEQKWVLLVSINPGGLQGGSATQYFVGSFNGNRFVIDKQFEKNLGSSPEEDPPGNIFEDFESGYEGWEISGNAFGTKPAKGKLPGQNDVSGYSGNGLVNSFAGGDASTGEMISKPFMIKKPFINLRVGGGNDYNQTYVALLVDSEEVKKAIGSNSEQLHLRSWSVDKYIGKEARIAIVDKHMKGWGHINVDDIKFAERPAKPKTEQAMWLDYGADNYAGVTWSDIPPDDGRRLFMGWMSNWQYATVVPTERWRSAMTIPRKLLLKQDSTVGYRIWSIPVKELRKIQGKTVTVPYGNTTNIHENSVIAVNFDDSLHMVLSNTRNEKVTIKVNQDFLELDRTESGIVDFHPDFAAKHAIDFKGVIPQKLAIYLDNSSLELFINDGEMVMTELIFPSEPYSKVRWSDNVEGIIHSQVKTIWR
jgi:beta-fructofuranosidase/levanase/fructan beta-fructosidase